MTRKWNNPAGGGNAQCGNGGCGTVFKITTAGTLTTRHSFDLTDGYNPEERCCCIGSG